MLPVRNFNPFVVETISPRTDRKPGEINELKLDLRGEEYAEDQTAATSTTTMTTTTTTTSMRGVGRENA